VSNAWAGEQKGTLPQLDVATFPSQIFWLLLTFGVLYFLVSKSALPHIHEVVEKRRHRIERDLEQAERLSIEAQDAKLAYEKLHREAVSRAKALIAKVTHELETKHVVEHAKLDADIVAMMHEAEQKIDVRQHALRDNLSTLGDELVQLLLSELTGKNLDMAAIAALKA
jgi:F-type H+-transporting ATPase subunit b